MRVAIFPARGGSKRIPRKNIRDFRGKPMLQWAVEAARASELFDEIIVSTDDDEIMELGVWLMCEVHIRDPDDGAKGTQDVVADALRQGDVWTMYDSVCTIYPCSPLLTPDLLQESHNEFMGCDAHHLVSTYAGEPRDAGCFYWQSVPQLMKGARAWHRSTLAFPLPPDRCIDINTPEDWARAEQMFDALHST